jgi:hypothetical protein
MAAPIATPETPSRLRKFLDKNPREMAKSVRWNLGNLARSWRNKARFGLVSWTPRSRSSAFLAYYPDGFHGFGDTRDLYRRWLLGNKTNNNGDASRFIALMLNLRQLDKDAIPGDFAELGVFKGNSAALLAHFAAQSGRRLFLFDTFQGFDPRDLVGVDQAQGHRTEFADTSLGAVRENVRHDGCTVYVPGFFPESITDEVRASRFALAHIDCDLFLPMKAALEFFYARMPRGGLLLLHDYGSGTWDGATRAIDEFTQDTGEYLILWPDKSGTAAIRKSR